MAVILGIDPGLNHTGYGIVTAAGGVIALLEAGTIEGGKETIALPLRLRTLHEGMVSLLMEYQPRAVAIEQLYSHYAHPRTAILMGHARGVLCLAAADASTPVFDYAPTEVKSSLTGNGRADKEQVRRVVKQILQLHELPHPLDVSDALAIAITHCYRDVASRTQS